MGALIAGLLFPTGLGAEPSSGEPPQGRLKIEPQFLWTGSWETGKNTAGRADLRLTLPLWGLSLRAQLTDKRPAALEAFVPGDFLAQGNLAFGGGLYHGPSGSRLLYGIIDEWGLPARLRNPWGRSVPFPDYHKPQAADLKTEASSTKKPEAYLYLGTPRLELGGGGRSLGGFVSVLVENNLTPAFGGGLDLRPAPKMELRLEGFYTGWDLPSRKGTAWFSETPPLPEREFRLYALGFLFNSPLLALSTDWGYVETFAYGRDLYGNLGLRLGDRPWQFSLALDGAGDRYVGRDGSASGGGFRAAARLDRRGKGSSLFRLSAGLRAEGLGKAFDRSSTQIYYRFPAAPKSAGTALRLARTSLTLSRNGSNPAKIEDKLEGVLGLKWGTWSPLFRGSITGRSAAEEAAFPFPGPEGLPAFEAARLAAEISWNPGRAAFDGKLGCTMKKDREASWDASLSASIRGKPGRLSLKVASPDFPKEWSAALSWRLELK